MLTVDSIPNSVVDSQHRVVGAVAGEVTRAPCHGCRTVAQRGRVLISKLDDILLASAGGYLRTGTWIRHRNH